MFIEKGQKMGYISRNMAKKLENAVKDFSAVYLSGARQCGKSTLVRNILSADEVNYITFDTTAIMLAAKKDPEAFISSLPKNKLNIIDEIQRVPEVYLALKKYVDDKRFEGGGKTLFLLTGSANIPALPELAKFMVGRMAMLALYPFSVAEINNTEANFIGRIWNEDLFIKSYEQADLIDLITKSTFPEISLDKDIDRSAWFDSYLATILQRDAVEFAKIRRPELIYQLLVSLAGRVGSLIKNEDIMKDIGMNQFTFEKYKAFCNAAFMTFEIPSWSKPNKLDKRFVRSKKLYFTDTNFLCFLIRRDIREVFEKDRPLMGHLFENFVATEIMKSISVLPGKFYVSHFNPVRGHGKETDFVIENDSGEAIAIEVKLDSSLSANDFKNLELCRDAIGDKFKRGVVLYTGKDAVPFGDKLWALPM
uniref:ATPase n=1 Tax=uncultured bacterium contig00085 TaxID=1181558 RepID=A0A806KL25_9BACT|nr:ATPase [uncultured bacterium contig00085]